MLGRVVEVDLDQGDEQHTHVDLQHVGNEDKTHHGDKGVEAGALLDDGLQLRGFGHQQGDVQHVLSYVLLVSIIVHVEGPVQQDFWMGARRVQPQVTVELIPLRTESMAHKAAVNSL